MNDVFLNDCRGVVTDEGSSLIESEFIKSFIEREHWVPDEHRTVKHVLVTCDPNGSGSANSSEMALIATTQISGQRFVRIHLLLFLFSFFLYTAV